MSTTDLFSRVARSERFAGKKSTSDDNANHLRAFYLDQLKLRGGEPDRKRVKAEHSETEVERPKLNKSSPIPIARVNIVLSDALPSRIDHSPAITDAVEVSLVRLDSISNGILTLKLAKADAKYASNAEVALDLNHSHSHDELQDLRRIAQLQRRGKQNATHEIAYSRVMLGRLLTARDQSFLGHANIVDLALQCTIYWPDGVSARGSKSEALENVVWKRYLAIQRANPEGRSHVGQVRWATPQDFYEAVHTPKKDVPVPDAVEHCGLETELYPFQKRTVTWMLHRERASVLHVRSDEAEATGVSWRQAQDLEGRLCYVSELELAVITPYTLQQKHSIKGGILCEEMGLGKTCELLALICINRSTTETSTQSGLTATKATLIVTPETLLQQWKDEISRHAPDLLWTQYEGMVSFKKLTRQKSNPELDAIVAFTGMDIVLVTYQVLAGEIHYAKDPPHRSLRRTGYTQQRRKSPLVLMDWWRVCLDEAQMVESGVSRAAQTASLLPRQNAWAISGTPVKGDVHDLRGLLIFLDCEPYASSPAVWTRMINSHKTFGSEFEELFRLIALRHTKDQIRDELRLPPQHRVVAAIPFTTIEEQNYLTLFEQMADECGLNIDGTPASGLWDPDDARVVEKMREWLVRLRQTCLHPQVGSRNQRALGRSGGPLRTVEEVLGVMIAQNESALATEARALITNLCLKGHIIANAKDVIGRSRKALELYSSALERCQSTVKRVREGLASLPAPETRDESELADEDEESPEQKNRGHTKNVLRNFLELEHMCEFFMGTACFQAKSTEAVTEPSERWDELEKMEIEHYDKAKLIRREILRETAESAEKVMQEVDTIKHGHIDNRLPSMLDFETSGGIESQRVLEKAHDLSDILQRQTEVLVKWRVKVADLLLKRLVDVEDNEITGDEYEDSTTQQDLAYAYLNAYRAVVADRSACITGQINTLVNHEIDQLYKESLNQDHHDVQEGKVPLASRQFLRDLLDERKAIKQYDDRLVSLRGLVREARSIESSLQLLGSDSARSRYEAALLKRFTSHLQTMSETYGKLQPRLEKEQETFRLAMNQRIEFYRQLQQLSDTVAPWREQEDEVLDRRELDAASSRLSRHRTAMVNLYSKRRFLLHLREQSSDETVRICVICQQTFDQGVLTVCGHQYCKECINRWYRQHRTCPVCKLHLKDADLHNITYRPQQIRVHEEHPNSPSSPTRRPVADATAAATRIYTNISASDLSAIRSVILPTKKSFGTKIDTLARHLLHIRRTSPGSKTLIFSQYRDFLSILSSALTLFGISHVSIQAKNSITRFRTDPSIEAFLLDAKTDSSGLNLVVATNVMLCEPLANPGIELQAIARVHRIGQTRPTSVFMYLVSGTVEEAVYEVSVRRRLEIMRGSGASSSGTHTPAVGEVDRAERMEMQANGLEGLLGRNVASGENVRAEDLWKCLFGTAGRRAGGFLDDANDVESFVTGTEGGAAREEVGRFVRAEAADLRRGG